jgi:flagellar biosynthesis anti-sigma factor FlgM
MRIDSSQTAQPLPESGRGGNLSPAGTEARAAMSSALGEDSAQFSGTGVQIQALVAQTLQFPEIREEKVNALRQLVAGGSYKPSPKQVAEAVFAEMQAAPAA